MKEKTITLLDKNGNEVKCEIVAIFHYGDKNYMAYVDGSMTEGNMDIMVSRYKDIDGKIELEEIVNEEEWKFVTAYLDREVFEDGQYD